MATPNPRLRARGFLPAQLPPVANKTPRGLVWLARRVASKTPRGLIRLARRRAQAAPL